MISYKITPPETRAAKRRAYQERKLKAAEENVQVNADGTVNIEYWIFERFKEMVWDCSPEEQMAALKVMCDRYQADFERVKLYITFS